MIVVPHHFLSKGFVKGMCSFVPGPFLLFIVGAPVVVVVVGVVVVVVVSSS